MNKPFTNPFLENDFTKMFDASKMMDVSKYMGDFKMPAMPGMDVLMSAHRKNIEAFTSANQAAFEGFQALARRQTELARQSIEDTASIVNAVMSNQTPEEKMAKQTEATKATMERTVATLKEITEMLSRTNYQTMEVISNRMSEGLEELRGMMKNGKAAA